MAFVLIEAVVTWKEVKQFKTLCAHVRANRRNRIAVLLDVGAQLRMRIQRSGSGGWYVKEHVAKHNHQLSSTFSEKQQWRSHRHIDSHTKQLIKHLRDNNVNLTKVFSIDSSFFGSVGNAPFTKRTVRTLCAKLAKDNAVDDIGRLWKFLLS